ncbi:DUF6807 family protein [Pseudactinotalea suaedae]|uniref:DUF6807 family protein n=1 Tax=Pseudactinotalea suaedae TaxID=1524924 RepID=UPI0012E2E9C0|nr:DUF6807 family protein [Pseudactinotalea suaedae]
MNGPRHATIGDVAKLAGVSVATVSRVMNAHPAVKPETLERVRDAAAQLDYVPSSAARSLSLGRTHTVALLMPDLSNPMFQQVLRGANRAAAAAGYRLLVSDSVEDPEAEADLAIEARRRSDALILCSPRMSPRDLRRVLSATEPVVLINREAEAAGVPSLVADYAEGVRILVRRLMRHGHRSFVYLSGPPRSIPNSERVQALRVLAREHEELTLSVLPCGGAIEDGYAALGPVLESGATAVLAYNDVVAFGLLGKLNEAGVAVPGDISVAGYDDIPFSRYATPPLTTISVPKEELGRHAWEEVERMLGGDRRGSTLRFPPRLVERGSTGPVPREHMPPAIAEVVNPALAWHRDDDDVAAELSVAGALLARYERRPVMPDVYSPRPYLHPLYTLAGAVLTDAGAPVHRHQHGISVAFPDVDGITYWGGRTYLEDSGPALLANHGTQMSTELVTAGAATDERLVWHGPDGAHQLSERRRISASIRDDRAGWELSWRSALTADDRDVVIASPAGSGRPDARYGGIFWRFPTVEGVTIHTADGDASAHGARSPWVALVHRDETRPWTVVLRQVGAAPVPWHVRTEGYLALCPAIAWDGPVRIARGETYEIGLDAVVLDDALTLEEIEGIAPA